MLPVFRVKAGQQSKNGNHHSHPRHSTIYQLQTIIIIIQNSSYMHKTSSSMPQSKDSTECSQNPYCLQPTLLPTSVFLLLPQTFVLPNQTHFQCSHILANHTACESRQGQMNSVALTTPSQSEPPSPISLLKSLRLVSTLTASLVSI